MVAELGELEAHVAADEIVHDALALVGHAEADHRGIAGGLARGALLGAQREAAARVDERPPLALRLGALGRELLGRAVAAVGAALGEELLARPRGGAARRSLWTYGAWSPPTPGPSSHSSPTQRSERWICSIASGCSRVSSVSSMRSTKRPPWWRA